MTTCAKCGCDGEIPLVHFWNGRDYCRACLDAAMPGLSNLAMESDCFVEEIPCDFREFRISWGLVAIKIALLFGVPAFAVAFPILKVISFMGMIGFLTTIVAGIQYLVFQRFLPRIVFLKEGTFGVLSDGRGRIAIPIAECGWAEGKAELDSHVGLLMKRQREALLVKYPSRLRSFRLDNPLVVACGLTPPTKETWTAIRTLTEDSR